MPQCDSCHGVGFIPAASAFGVPVRCSRCSGSGKILLKDLCAGDHACYFHSDRHKQLRAAASFIADGLRQKERCIYITDENTPEKVSAALSANGIRMKEALESEAVTIQTKHDAYLKGGYFAAKNMLSRFEQLINETLEKGFHTLRVVGETNWVLEENRPICDQFLKYELMVDDYFTKEKPRFVALCVYNTQRFPETVIEGMRHAHRFVFQE